MKNNKKNKEKSININISQAAKLGGLSMKTVRQGVTKMEIKHFLQKNRYKINLTDFIIWCHNSARRRNIFYKQGMGKFSKQWTINNYLYTPLGKHKIK